MTIYDNQFNGNELFILIGFCLGYLLVFILPKRFSYKATLLFVICGIYSGFFYDHSLSIEPVDFYDVNDNSSYQFIDFISYLMYGPWSFLFFYIWDKSNIKFRWIPVYILVWGLFSIGLEKIALMHNVYHYKNGYHLAYSYPIYLLTLSIWSTLYFYLRVKKQILKGSSNWV